MQKREPHLENANTKKLPVRLNAEIMKSERLALSAKGKGQLNKGLRNAAAHGDNAEILRLMKAGADIAAKDSTGWTPLQFAIGNDHTKACILILAEYAKAGGDMEELINTKDKNGWSGQHYAKNTGTVKFLNSLVLLADMMQKSKVLSFIASFGECIAG